MKIVEYIDDTLRRNDLKYNKNGYREREENNNNQGCVYI